jgi:protein TonB
MGHVTFGPSTGTAMRRRRQWFTVPLSMLVHTLVLGSLVVVPLVATGALPTPQSVMTAILVVQPPASPPAPSPAPRHAPPPAIVDPSINPDAAPLGPPDRLTPEPMQAVVNLGVIPLAGSGPVQLGTPAPPPTPAAVSDVPLRVGGHIKEPRKIRDVQPVYPAMARAARAEGMVIIEATIARDGSVRDARVLRSHPLLDEAALAAVREWRYSAPLLNGVPVEVVMTVTVNFVLR